jgi:glycosyltransferase involved in cell wall biosynthesis
MNIWMLNHYAISPDMPGSTRHYEFACEFVKAGHRVTIFASSFNHRLKKDLKLNKGQNYLTENINGISFTWIRTVPYHINDWHRSINMISYLIRIIPYGLKLKEKPDVIIASSPHPFAGFAGWFIARIRKAKFLFEVMDLWPQTLIDIAGYNKNNPVVKILFKIEQFLYDKADRIVALMPGAVSYISSKGISADKISYIPLGANPFNFQNNAIPLSEKLNQEVAYLRSQNKFLVGYAGAHGIANALDTIIDAAVILQKQGADNIHFLFVGDGPEKERLVNIAKNNNINNVTFFEPVPKDMVPSLLQTLDIEILTWNKTDMYVKYGISSNKLWDYMMAAKPIVWAIDSANDPVKDAGCGITVPSENPEQLAKAIVQLYNLTDEERAEMGKRGYKYVMENNSVPLLFQKLLDLIYSIE